MDNKCTLINTVVVFQWLQCYNFCDNILYISNNNNDNVLIVCCQYSVNIMFIVDQTNITITLYKWSRVILIDYSNDK